MKDSTIHLGSMNQGGAPEAPLPRRRGIIFWKILIFLIIVGIAVCAWSAMTGYSSWRAVFLSNNQVYFGHFWSMPFASSITLHNVYYLEVAQGEQLPSQGQQLKLVRLGNEIHGPTDEMTIPMSQVLFWETLRPDSAVVAAIKSLTQ